MLLKNCPEVTNVHNKLECMDVPGKPYHLCIMFVGMAGAYPSGAYFSYSSLGKALGLACKH
jgi:hypothetical protein